MLPDPAKSRKTDNGAALIVVLGILTIITLLVVAFMVSSQINRLTARNFRRQSAAEHYIRAGIPLAMSAVANTMTNATIPAAAWRSPILYYSTNDTTGGAVIVDDVTNAIPIGWRESFAEYPDDFKTEWLYVINRNSQGETIATNGRIAFIVGDLSGFLDINSAPTPILTEILGITPDRNEKFYSISDLTTGSPEWINLTSNLVCDSCDIGPDTYITTNQLPIGRRAIRPFPRFPVNLITNLYDHSIPPALTTYHSPEIQNDYISPVLALLRDAGFSPESAESLLWNLINYIDNDSLPQDNTLTPWLSHGLAETVPIINEITLLPRTPDPSSESNHYEFAVELWYPYPPESFSGADLALSLNIRQSIKDVETDTLIFNKNSALSITLTDMEYIPGQGGFQVLYSGNVEPVKFPLTINTETGTRDIFLPIGTSSASTYVNPAWITRELLSTAALSASLSNTTLHATVDLAMDNGNLTPFTNLYGYAAIKPLHNSSPEAWKGPLSSEEQSLGFTNGNNWVSSGYETPVFIRNNPLVDIGEMGLICTSSLESVNCMASPGAALFDYFTVRAASNSVVRGLVGIGAAEPVWSALFKTTGSGITNTPDLYIDPVEAEKLADAFTYTIDSSDISIPTWGTILPLMADQTNWLTNLPPEQREAPLRQIIEKVSFRQNIFVIWLLAQATTDDGERALSERRATAIVLRDAFTGKWSLKNLQWIETTP